MADQITRTLTLNEIDGGASFTVVLADGTEINYTDMTSVECAKRLFQQAMEDAKVPL